MSLIKMGELIAGAAVGGIARLLRKGDVPQDAEPSAGPTPMAPSMPVRVSNDPPAPEEIPRHTAGVVAWCIVHMWPTLLVILGCYVLVRLIEVLPRLRAR